MCVRACVCVQSNAWSNCTTHFQHLGEEGFQLRGLVKHEPLLSLKEKLCLNQGLFAPAVICLRTSAGANKHVRSAQLREKGTRSARANETKWTAFARNYTEGDTNNSAYVFILVRGSSMARRWRSHNLLYSPAACLTAKHVHWNMARRWGRSTTGAE